MKIKPIITGISPLICVLGWSFILVNPVQAASFNFTYTLESGAELSGSFEGDIGDDNNEVNNLRNLIASYSEVPTVIFDNVETGSFFSLDLSEFQLLGESSSPTSDTFSVIRASNGNQGVEVFIPPTLLDSDGLALDRLEVEVNIDTEVQTTPEPGMILTLALLGSFGFWQKVKNQQTSSL